MTGAALAFALLGFGLLGSATDAHDQHRFGVRATGARKHRMRLGAWAALVVSFLLAVAARGWVFGPVVWAGLAMLAAGAVFLFLNFATPPERTRR